MTPEAVTLFLDSILEGDAPVYGGFSYTVRLYRAYYEAKTNIFEMWKGKLIYCIFYLVAFSCLNFMLMFLKVVSLLNLFVIRYIFLIPFVLII